MSSPIYEEMKATLDLVRATARIEARQDLVEELRKIQKPTKPVKDLIESFARVKD